MALFIAPTARSAREHTTAMATVSATRSLRSGCRSARPAGSGCALRQGRTLRSSSFSVSCSAAHAAQPTRREAIASAFATVALASLPLPPQAVAADDGLVLFTPKADKTPALRAGVIKNTPFYRFSLPTAGWKEKTVANIASG